MDATSHDVNMAPKHSESRASASVNRTPQVHPVGDHVLLKRFTVSFKAIDSAAALSAARMSSAFAEPVVEQGQLKRFSAKNLHSAVKSTQGTVEMCSIGSASSSSSSADQQERVHEAQHGLLKKFSAKAIDAASRFTPSESSTTDQPILDHGLLRKFSAKAINAAGRFTPSESNTADQPAYDHGLRKKFSAKAIDPAVRFPPSESSSVDEPVDDHRLLKKFSATAIDAAARFTPLESSTIDQSILDHGLLKKFSAKAIDAAARFTPSESSTADQPLYDHELPKKFSAKAIDPAIRFPPSESSSVDEPVDDHGLLKKFSAKAIDPAVRFPPSVSSCVDEPVDDHVLLEKFSAKAIDAAASFTLSESSTTDQPILDHGLLKKFSAKAIDPAIRFPPSESSSVDEPVDDHGLLKKFSAKAIDSAARYTLSESSTTDQPVHDHGLLKKFSAKAIDAAIRFTPSESSTVDEPVDDHGLLKKFSAEVIDASVRITPSESSTVHEPVDDHGLRKQFSTKAIDEAMNFPDPFSESNRPTAEPVLEDRSLKKFSARASDAAITSTHSLESSANAIRSSTSRSRSFVQPVVESDHGVLKKFSPKAIDNAVRFNPSSAVKSSSSSSSTSLAEPVADVVHGILKKFSPEAIDTAARFTPSSENKVYGEDPKMESKSEFSHSHAHSFLKFPPLQVKTLRPRSSSSISEIEVEVAPPKIFAPVARAKAGGVLDIDEPKVVRICVLGVRGRVLYLEVYKDFVDLLLNFLTMRTGALIKLLREVDTGLEFGGAGAGILNVYDSVSKLNESMLTVDKDPLIDPTHKLNLTEELQSLNSFEPECCNADCPKYISSSRLVCKNCTISNHFSCTVCNAYFRDNVHTTMCYAPWRPWGTHVSAAPVLNRYTVVQSMDAIMSPESRKLHPPGAQAGFVKNGVPFMITNELNISPLTTRSIAKVLKSLNDEDGKTEELDCHELLIGKAEVVFLLSAAMTSLTPLTDVFAHMCKSVNKISATETLSGFTTISQELAKRASSIAKPLKDLITFVRPLASEIVGALQQGNEATVKRFSNSQGVSKPETSELEVHEDSPTAATRKELSSSDTSQGVNPEISSPGATRKTSLLATPQVLTSETPSPAATEKKSSSITATQVLILENLTAAEDNAPPRPAIERKSNYVPKPRLSISKTVEPLQLVPTLLVEASPPALPSTSEGFQQEQLQDGLGGDQPSAQLMVSRKSSGIVQQKSIFLAPEETDDSESDEPSPTSIARREFVNKFLSSRVVKTPKEKKEKRKTKKKKQKKENEELERHSNPSLTRSSTTQPTAETQSTPDSKRKDLYSPTADQSVAQNDQSKPASSDPTPNPDPVPTQKKRRKWFKIFSPKSADPHPDTIQLPTPPTPPEPTAWPEGVHVEEEEEDEYKVEEYEAQASSLSPAAVAPFVRRPEKILPDDSAPEAAEEFASTAADVFSPEVSNAEIMMPFPFQHVKIETDFPTGGFS